jgi:ubiquinone/menaquinone biosynthesis C-methylase UbiE
VGKSSPGAGRRRLTAGPDQGVGYRPGVSSNEASNPIFARLFDRFAAKDKGRGEDELRREMLAGLRGHVVEVGPGNGINFEHYPDSVTELVAVEPEPYLRQAAERTASSIELDVSVVGGVAEDLPVQTGSAEAVVVAGVLCSVPDQAAALAEFQRVLRPGGELRFYEHVRSRRPGFARFQDLSALVWPRLMGGCQPNRETLAAIEAAGFRIERCRGFGFPPAARAYPVLPRILGVARVAG